MGEVSGQEAGERKEEAFFLRCKFHQNVIKISPDIFMSKLFPKLGLPKSSDTFSNPMSYGLNYDSHLLPASSDVSFVRFTFRGFLRVPANVRLWDSPHQSRGFTPINYDRGYNRGKNNGDYDSEEQEDTRGKVSTGFFITSSHDRKRIDQIAGEMNR